MPLLQPPSRLDQYTTGLGQLSRNKCIDMSLTMCVHVGAWFSANLDKQTDRGSTALHYCCLTDNSECLKLLLRGKASVSIGKNVSPSEQENQIPPEYDQKGCCYATSEHVTERK